jgi:hypothetical protein
MRIHHFSFPAHDPERVAGVLAELLGARVVRMPHPEGALFVYGGDADGTVIEVWPTALRIDADGVVHGGLPLPPAWPHHAFITSDACDPDQVLAAFAREGWRAQHVHNGPPDSGFDLVRGWIENAMQIEIGGSDMRKQYERAAAGLAALPTLAAPHR